MTASVVPSCCPGFHTSACASRAAYLFQSTPLSLLATACSLTVRAFGYTHRVHSKDPFRAVWASLSHESRILLLFLSPRFLW
jgi:hypothetical protein